MAGRLVNKAIVLALIVSLAIPAQAWSEKAAKSLPHERSKWGGQATEPPVVLAGTAFDAGIPAPLRKVIAAEREKLAKKKEIKAMNLFAAELEDAPEGAQPQDIPDPFHLTEQFLTIYDKKNINADRYHLVGIEKGLPRIVPQPDAIKVENVNGHLGFRFAHAMHSIESIKPHVIAADAELVVVIDKQGAIFVIDYVFAKRELMRGLVPVHRISFRVSERSKDLSGLRLTFITRGLQPFTHKMVAGGEFQPLRDNIRFTAGDLAMWQEVGDKKILLEVVERQVLIAEVNANNYLLGSVAYMVRADKPQEIARALQLQRQKKFNDSDEKEVKEVMASRGALNNLEKMSAGRMQRIVMGGVANNNYRDSFTYARWQRDYLIVRDQAERTIAKLEKSVNKKYKIIKDRTSEKQMQRLKDQLRAGNFNASWITLSKNYVEDAKELVVERIVELKQHNTEQARQHIAVLEDILRKNDFQRLWDEPQLFADLNNPHASPFRAKVKRGLYKHLNREVLQDIGLSVLGVSGVVGLAAGAAWVIKGGFTLSSIIPEVLKQKKLPNGASRRHLLYGMGLFALSIPVLAALGFLTARATGQEWSFKKQLTLMGIRADAWLSLPFWHHIANWTGQKTLLPALGAEISPFTKISGKSLTGQTIGLQPDESIRVGFDNPSNDNDGEFVNRQVLLLLQEQRIRAQAIGWEIASDILFSNLHQKLQAAGAYSQEVLFSAINTDDFRSRWKKFATVLEAEVFQLHKDGVFFDLRKVTKEHVYNFLRKTKPQVFDPDHQKNLFAQSAYYLKKATTRAGRFLAEGGTDRIYFLQHADPDEFVSSFNWEVFWVDYITVIVWEGLCGARAQLSEPNLLFAQRKLPWTHPHMQSDLVNQIAKRQVKDNGQLSLIFQLLQKIEEKNYTPMEEILYAGANGKDNFFQGLYNYGKNSVDFRNVDYGGKFMEALMATVATLQSTFILAMVFRVMLAKVPVAKAVPQIALLLSWSMWAFSFPWFILASVTKLRDTKRDARNDVFMHTKVNLQKAIAEGATDDIAQEYRHLTATYQRSKTRLPQALLASLQQVEDRLGIIKHKRLSPAALYPYLALVLKINSSHNAVEQRELYRHLVELIDSNADYEVSVADAEATLQFSLQHPPFAKRSNGAVDSLLLWTVAIVTTYLGGYFYRDSFNEAKNPRKLLGFLEQERKYGKLKTKLSRRGMIVMGVPLYFLLYFTLGKENYRRIEDKVRSLLHLGEASGADY